MEVPGISAKKCEQIRDSYLETRGARRIITMLAPLDISAARAVQLQKKLGRNAEALLREHPYQVYEKGALDFQTADKLAQSNGISRTDPERTAAGLLHTLELAEQRGHLSLHKEEFVQSAVHLLDTPELTRQAVARQAFEMLQAGRLTLYREFVYRTLSAKAEQGAAMRIRELLEQNQLPYMGDLDEEIDRQQEEMGIILAEEQRHAVKTALTSPICIISGGPGTGKTLIQRVMLHIYTKAFPDAKVVCCAPTGRAARRMEQSTGFFAATVHKALGLTSGEINELELLEPLDADLVLVDEVSMLDMVLTWYLLNALPPACRLILVGDADQLPSVGPGAVLSELIACGRIPVVMLDKVFRQDEGSRIAENAKLIRHNQTELQFGEEFQFHAAPDFARSAELLERLYLQEVNRCGLDNVALLTPFRRKTETGVQALNQRFQALINPQAPDKSEIAVGQRVLRLGDKVMQIQNQDEVSNGDVGYIRAIDQSGDGFCVEVDFGDSRIVAYEDYEGLNKLDLAYASTIHKSQGSEYDSVLITLQYGHRNMLKRPLIYTALTRARRRAAVVGDWSAVRKAIQTVDTERRNTLLAARITETEN
ncbi:ATP-dependent RecD-like DNA helicase [bioreactor metagenome]|uniref:ATP-dependent RecD-like DNA helicase n=1 Tax=bioreactor metagenome TaxID=1076179 RepID=A0A644XG54_9ZZZZ